MRQHFYNPPFSTPFELNRNSPQARGLVGWWPVAGTTTAGLNVRNRAVNGAPATKTGTITDTYSAVVGKALTFDGSTGYLALAGPNIPVTSFTLPWTVAFWLRTMSDLSDKCFYGEGSSSSANPFLQIAAPTVSPRNTLRVHIRNDAGSNIINAAGSTIALYGTSGYQTDWVHICFTDNAGSAVLYINGVADATSFAYAPSGTLTLNRSSMGCLLRASPVNFAACSITDLRQYRRSLSAAEVWALYDPRTRWDLYAPLRQWYIAPTVAAAAAGQPAIKRLGGIAGAAVNRGVW